MINQTILIYGGTTEGRMLAEQLCRAGVSCLVCVATEYGEIILQSMKGLRIHQGRMNREEMEQLTDSEDFLAVVDATHPFAAEVSKNIKESLTNRKIPYLRLKRNTVLGGYGKMVKYYKDQKTCAEALLQTEGNILLTTGSKDLKTFCIDELKERLYVRVLPAMESLALCEEQGISGKQVIAMQGPFCTEMNEALIRQFQIRVLVTKESGAPGGLFSKLESAANTGTAVYMIGKPEQEEAGMSYDETVRKLYELAELKLQRTKLHISLIGMGMGRAGLMTIEAKEALREAEVLFGAKRLIENQTEEKETYPYYKAEDILQVIEERYAYGREEIKMAVLFSGDTGFYSGAKEVYRRLSSEEYRGNIHVRLLPGISSMTYLASAGGISLKDTAVLSIHGRNADILRTVKENRKTFLLASGAEDMRKLGEILTEKGFSHVSLLVGFQLSYPEEEIKRMTPKDCRTLRKDGLYCCFIENETTQERHLTHGRSDENFLRGTYGLGRIPMTKEEVREVSICKLQLTAGAVLYDIGSGSGSVAVECAGLTEGIRVYAIEREKEAAELIRDNCAVCGVSNVEIIEGTAPEALAALPAPTHAFIGGSGGRLLEILEVLYEKNPRLRVVINAITLETAGMMTEIKKKFSIEQEEIVYMQVSRARKTGNYHLMQAENGVWIISF